jgi:hypothetical protein
MSDYENLQIALFQDYRHQADERLLHSLRADATVEHDPISLSEVRFAKCQGKLFTFLDYDGVPRNNNNAEHAVKRFVYLDAVVNGSSTPDGMREYLILLSIYETLRRKNVSFLRFLVSGATNIDEFVESQTRRRRPR